jgi:hypothetical protein
MTQWQRWRGLKALIHDSINGASRAVERVQKETASRWFDRLEAVPPLAPPVRIARVVHDGTTASVHAAIRLTSGLVAAAADGVISALEAVEAKREATKGPTSESSPATEDGEPLPSAAAASSAAGPLRK